MNVGLIRELHSSETILFIIIETLEIRSHRTSILKLTKRVKSTKIAQTTMCSCQNYRNYSTVFSRAKIIKASEKCET